MILIILTILNMGLLYAQSTYQLTGVAANIGTDCYRLTPASNSQTGAAWNTTQIDLSCDFDWSGTFNVGFDNPGADGMAFVFQNAGTNIQAVNGLTGTPLTITSLAIELDSYENNESCNPPPNGGDPCGGCPQPNGDHVSLYQNADAQNALVPALCVPSFANGANHNLDISWSYQSNTLIVKIDGLQVISYTGDVVNNIFGGNASVYYGFVARTGGENNIQSFCHTSSANDNCCPTDRAFID